MATGDVLTQQADGSYMPLPPVTATQGPAGPQGEQGIPGPQGPTGPQGPAGSGSAPIPATLAVGPGGYPTLAAALATLPSLLDAPCAISCTGTFAEPIVLTRFVSTAQGKLTIQGGTFTGTVPVTDAFLGSFTTPCHIAGPVRARLDGVTTSGGTAGSIIRHGAQVELANITSPAGGTHGMLVLHGALTEVWGNITLTGFTTTGLQVDCHAQMIHAVGTITLQGPNNGTGTGFGVSRCSVYRTSIVGSGLDVTVRDYKISTNTSLCSVWQHRTGTGIARFLNTTMYTGSRASLVTDCASFSIANPVQYRNIQQLEDKGSNGWSEMTGSVTAV